VIETESRVPGRDLETKLLQKGWLLILTKWLESWGLILFTQNTAEKKLLHQGQALRFILVKKNTRREQTDRQY
jgi:hypothetical protein